MARRVITESVLRRWTPKYAVPPATNLRRAASRSRELSNPIPIEVVVGAAGFENPVSRLGVSSPSTLALRAPEDFGRLQGHPRLRSRGQRS